MAARRVRAPSRAAARERREQERRQRRLRASHSYGLVLGLVITTFLFALLASDAAWTASMLVLLLGVTLGCALWSSGIARLRSVGMLAVSAFVVATAAGSAFRAGHTTAIMSALLSGVLAAAVAFVIARGVVDQGEVNWNSVRGAIAIYLLLGLLFVFAYSAVARIGSGPLFVQGTDGTRSERVYFSYVTLATVGYGDYSPKGDVGHTLAVFEALLGQLYLVTVVAVLVSRLGQGSGSADDAADPPPLIPKG